MECSVLGKEGNEIGEGKEGDSKESAEREEEGGGGDVPEKGGDIDEEEKEEEEFHLDGVGEKEKDFGESEGDRDVCGEGRESRVVIESIVKRRRRRDLSVVMMERRDVAKMKEKEYTSMEAACEEEKRKAQCVKLM